jgi:hypothetical protein
LWPPSRLRSVAGGRCLGVAGRYPWSRGDVDTKGAPVTLLFLAVLGHTADVRFYPLAAVDVPLHPMVLTGLGHTDHLLS